MSANPPPRKLSPLTCEVGDHSGNFSIYKTEIGGDRKWGCSPCIIKALGRVPIWLRSAA